MSEVRGKKGIPGTFFYLNQINPQNVMDLRLPEIWPLCVGVNRRRHSWGKVPFFISRKTNLKIKFSTILGGTAAVSKASFMQTSKRERERDKKGPKKESFCAFFSSC